MIVADTNVLFALVIDNDWSASAVRLYDQDEDWRTDTHALVELTNVLVRHMRNKIMTAEEARSALADAEYLMNSSLCSAGHSDVLDLAMEHRVSAYDARFLVAARFFGTRLVTEDVKLRNAAPELTRSIAEALAAV